jgi:hypothetical protein
LRLRFYYGIEGAELDKRLVDIRQRAHPSPTKPAGPLPSPWTAGRIGGSGNAGHLLNDEVPGEPWKVDPRRVQNAAANRTYRLARSLFRNESVLPRFHRVLREIVQFEKTCSRSGEGLVLGIAPKDVIASLG